MEQAKYWMWTRRRYNELPFVGAPMPAALAVGGSSYKESWEEQVFAEDAAGHLGGCVWPPRSYSCSFCRREFRSAQALGGHMNVHRRDRARLKLSSSPTSDALEDQEHPNPCTATGTQYQQQVASLVYGTTSTNPNPNTGVVAPTLSTVLQARSTSENWSGIPMLSPQFSSSCNSGSRNQEPQLYAMAGSFKDAIPFDMHMVPELKLGREPTLAPKVELRGLRRRREPEEEDDDDLTCSKRRRIDTIKFSVMEQTSKSHHLKTLQSEVTGPEPVEELDLELRLGDAPKVK